MRPVATVSGGEVRSPWFTAEEAAAYLRLGSLHAFHLAYPRLGIRTHRLGRRLRFHQDDLDAVLQSAQRRRR